LPEDCIEVLGIVDRGLRSSVHAEGTQGVSTSTNTAPDRGRLIFIDSAKEEQLYLDRDAAGDPIVGIEGMPTHLSPPQDAPIVLRRLEPDVAPNDIQTPSVNLGLSTPTADAIVRVRLETSEASVDPLIAGISFNEIEVTVNGTKTKPFQDMPVTPQLLSNVEYEYCYTFVYGGVESPPSPVARLPAITSVHPKSYAVIHSESTQGVFRRNNTRGPTSIQNPRGAEPLGELDMETKTRFTGRMKRFYRRKVPGSKTVNDQNGINAIDYNSGIVGNLAQGNGGWMHIGDSFGETSIDIGTKQIRWSGESTAPADHINFPHEFHAPTVLGWPGSYWMRNGFWSYHDGELQKVRRLDETGPRQSIRIYRPPSQDMDVEIRYLSRPKRLVANGDTPEWPPQYHHLLVYMALADICLQHGMSGQSQLYQRKSDELLDRMKQKYLSRTNRKYMRRGFDRAVFSGERFGIPTKA